MDLVHKVALITGSRRLGASVALELAKRGADVSVAYRSSRQEAEETASGVRQLGRGAMTTSGDLRSPEVCDRVVAETVKRLGRLDILVNMASIYQAKPLADLTVDDWDAQLAVDLRATWLCARAALPHMRRVGGGRIVNVSDWTAASRRPRYRGFVPYYVVKAGVIALTEALALELAEDQILVNAIAPGPIVAPEGTSEEDVASVEKTTPLGRWGGGVEIAKAVVALVETNFITGETIRVDGGRHLR